MMIYADFCAHRDAEECPAERGELCLNCGYDWNNHSGWACKSHNQHRTFSTCSPDERYLTQSMLNSSEDGEMDQVTQEYGCFFCGTKDNPKGWNGAEHIKTIHCWEVCDSKLDVVPVNIRGFKAVMPWCRKCNDNLGNKSVAFVTRYALDFLLAGNSPRCIENNNKQSKDIKTDDDSSNDWRAWAHNKPGDCPCGIARAQCKYHC